MSTNEYTNLTIIDCNRQHSIQSISGNDENTALFTNELGNGGIQLKVGDTISVQGAYISEIGAGADTIEFKGENSGKTRTITYTKETYKYPTNIEDKYSNGSDALPVIAGYQEVELLPDQTITYNVIDNDTYITIQYYLNNAGDSGYISLPRRFSNRSDSTVSTEWDSLDNVEQGRPYKNLLDNQFVADDYFYYDNSASTESSTGLYKLKNDCKRFTLMKRNDTTFLRRQRVEPNGSTISHDLPPEFELLSGANYSIFKQPIRINVDNGFNSPDSISDNISRILKEANAPVDFNIKYQDIIQPVSQYVETQTFKPQLCSSDKTMNELQYQKFTYLRNSEAGGTPEERLEGALLYWSNYYNVYHKRPEIREAGQLLNNYLGSAQSNRYDILYINKKTQTLKTNNKWTQINLDGWRNFFKSQKLYPELFSNDNAQKISPATDLINVRTSVDNSRYFHFNTQRGSTRTSMLGSDNINYNASNTNNMSVPQFIYFDKTNEDKFTEGNDINNLCYGFATKYNYLGIDYIELHPELLSGFNEELFKNASGDIQIKIPLDSLLGYDHHYNAYGTACLIGSSGRLRADYIGINEWGLGTKNIKDQEAEPVNSAVSLSTSEYMRFNYIGTNNPKFEYDPDNTRFYFSYLHTPELSGQEWISAGDNASGLITEISDNSQGGSDEVYKINKRVNPYTYTPDMKPYNYQFDPAISYNYNTSGASKAERYISQPNRSIQAWEIFDSMSGIFISDFGYDEEDWDTGLFGILGFTYKQFNQTLDSDNNRNSRIINKNINNLNIPTTNSDIVSTDTRSYIVNQFGANYFTTQLPTTSTIKSRQFTPAITEKTASIKLKAVNLPRKMLRPYYCIRSDIIDSSHYIGGHTSNTLLPVVAVCDKQYSGGDFVFSSEEDYVFTITKDKVITNITTSIHDPDQSFSRVNKDSAVIYKIKSQVINDTNIAEELLQDFKKK